MIAKQMSQELSNGYNRILEAIHPSLEQLLGKTDFPPDEETVEAFVDMLPMYGFHATDLSEYRAFRGEGLRAGALGNSYFIADRNISDSNIHGFYVRGEQPNLHQVSVREYFERFKNSLNDGVELVVARKGGDTIWGFLVLDRNLAVPNERIEAIEAGEPREWRGAGFLDGYWQSESKPLLDEGAVTAIGQVIRPEAIKGVIGPYVVGRKLVRDTTYFIKIFYQIVVDDFIQNYHGK